VIPGSATLTSVEEIGVKVGAVGVCREPIPIVENSVFGEIFVETSPDFDATEIFAEYSNLGINPGHS
jgi:hypothetical protein